MIDPLQLVLMIVISTLTILLVVIGIEVFRILREAKQTLGRVNRVLDDVETITSSISSPVAKLSSLVQGVQQGATFMQFFTKVLEVVHKKSGLDFNIPFDMTKDPELEQPQPQQGSSFMTGLMWGAMLGAAGYYLLATDEGKKLKDELLDKAKESLGTLKQEMEALPAKVETAQKEVKQIQKKVEKKAEDLQKVAQAELKQLEESVEEAKKKADAMQNELQKAAARIEKKFFVRKGKSLKK